MKRKDKDASVMLGLQRCLMSLCGNPWRSSPQVNLHGLWPSHQGVTISVTLQPLAPVQEGSGQAETEVTETAWQREQPGGSREGLG